AQRRIFLTWHGVTSQTSTSIAHARKPANWQIVLYLGSHWLLAAPIVSYLGLFGKWRFSRSIVG
ncbi:MAG: hypothetical protein ACXWQR_24475, partial [Ktedonobacterales bacterium]